MTNQSPDPTGTTFDQSGQTVENQTNIAGNLYTYNYALAVRTSILDAPSPDLAWLTAGRGEELAQLNQWYDAVLADKAGEQPRTVVVTGAAGMGKRELVQRWVLALPNHERPPTVVQSSYPPAYFDDGQQESFYATQPRWQAAWGSHVPPLRPRQPPVCGY